MGEEENFELFEDIKDHVMSDLLKTSPENFAVELRKNKDLRSLFEEDRKKNMKKINK